METWNSFFSCLKVTSESHLDVLNKIYFNSIVMGLSPLPVLNTCMNVCNISKNNMSSTFYTKNDVFSIFTNFQTFKWYKQFIMHYYSSISNNYISIHKNIKRKVKRIVEIFFQIWHDLNYNKYCIISVKRNI